MNKNKNVNKKQKLNEKKKLYIITKQKLNE